MMSVNSRRVCSEPIGVALCANIRPMSKLKYRVLEQWRSWKRLFYDKNYNKIKNKNKKVTGMAEPPWLKCLFLGPLPLLRGWWVKPPSIVVANFHGHSKHLWWEESNFILTHKYTEYSPSSALPSSGKTPSSVQNPASQPFLFCKSAQYTNQKEKAIWAIPFFLLIITA